MDMQDLFDTFAEVRKQGEQIGELRIQEAVFQWVLRNADELTIQQIKELRDAIKLTRLTS